MIVVSDTTPLISLLKTGRLDTLEKLFGEVRIPDAVFEAFAGGKFQHGAAFRTCLPQVFRQSFQ